jgi:hypothetical protein
LIPALVAGFDAITNHALLILFPVILDLFIWLAPHLRVQNLIETFLVEMVLRSAAEGPEVSSLMEAGQGSWLQLGEQVNLLAGLRTYPVGISSLMAASLPLETPMGMPRMFEISNLGIVLLLIMAFLAVGLILGTLYYLFVSRVALGEVINFRQSLVKWPYASLQVFLLALIWMGIFLVVSVPAACIVSVATLTGFSFGQFSILLYGGFLIWLIFPLLFSAHGIFVRDLTVWRSIRSGIRMTNMTLPTTVLFVLSVFVLSQGLDILWRIPPSNSWLTLLGIAGHAFVTTGLLSASFVYYRDADHWARNLHQRVQSLSNPDAQV